MSKYQKYIQYNRNVYKYFGSIFFRTNSSIPERNGIPVINNVNGYLNRNIPNQINSVGNPSRANVRSSHPQQYHSYPSIQQQHPSYQLASDARRIDDNVIRLPRGPDGTTGFMLKR